MGKKKRKSRENIYALLSLAAIIIVLYLVVKIDAGNDSVDSRKECPYKTEGNLNASLVIKYVDSPYCFWCWLEEPVLKKMVESKGDSFRLERYDIRYCSDITGKYRFSGTPSFVFSLEDGAKEYTHMGYIGKSDFYRIICELAGDCHME